ncbi:MAG: D-aminoacylase, partial [Gemmatimonadetes bacterium]|nr:D-aminoacylase [Gemmatimonadota bacterium]
MAFAIRSMSGLAADFLRLPDRGYVREGMIADVAVFDRDRIDDPSTYENPHQMAEGLETLFLNGRPVVQDSRFTGERAGVPILRGGATFEGARP